MSSGRFSGIALILFSWIPMDAEAQFRGYDDSFSDATVGVIQAIDPVTGAASVPGEFSTCTGVPANTGYQGFTSGMAYIGSTLYGIDWISGPDLFLYTFDTGFCATGARVGATAIGFANLESLAYCTADGFFYSADFDFSAHTGNLIRIDPATGIGTKIGGPMATDVRIGGMVYDPATDTLFALTLSFATRRPELLTIGRTTGVESVVGGTGTADELLQSLALDASVSPARLIAGGDAMLFELDRSTGTAGTAYGSGFNGTLWALANPDPGPPGPTATPTDTVLAPATGTPTFTEIPTFTETPTTTSTPLPEPTSTFTATLTEVPQPTSTATPTDTILVPVTATATPTNTSEPATPTETNTPALSTPTPTATPDNATSTPTVVASTATPTPESASPTATMTPDSIETPTETVFTFDVKPETLDQHIDSRDLLEWIRRIRNGEPVTRLYEFATFWKEDL